MLILRFQQNKSYKLKRKLCILGFFEQKLIFQLCRIIQKKIVNCSFKPLI